MIVFLQLRTVISYGQEERMLTMYERSLEVPAKVRGRLHEAAIELALRRLYACI